jgi:hypothetical protein
MTFAAGTGFGPYEMGAAFARLRAVPRVLGCLR